MVASISKWQLFAAYVLLALPAVFVEIFGGPYPVPTDFAVELYVCIGLAVGAAVFIVRRRPRNVAGWIGLAIWGGGSLLAIIHSLTG
jgi:peptidoglycan/LPS O-acetylase OafA/YrhL